MNPNADGLRPSALSDAGSGPTRLSTEPRYLLVLPWEPTRPPGGVDQVVLNLARELADTGDVQPIIAVETWSCREPQESHEHGGLMCRMRVRAPYSRRAGVLASLIRSPRLFMENRALERYLRERRVRFVNVHYPSLSALQFAWLRRRRGVPVKLLLSFHGMDLETAKQSSPLERWLWRVLARSSDHMVACSEALAVELRKFLPEDAAKIRAIHNGLDPASFFASRDVGADLDPRLSGRPFILSVAAYEPKKGLDVLIRAFHLCKPHWSRDVALVLVGGERGVGPQLRALAIELGLGSDVFFLEALAHAQLTAYFEAATLFCLPSRMEPFGIVLLEAGAFARPVVASRVGGIPEIITDGETGRLVAPEDPVELSRVLLELMGNTAERDRLGAALRTRVTAHFSWTRACRAYLDLCR